ncbi:MAG: HobA family DNA replication regulator, partial [Campylobacterales bacterium]|nr:HobA family DNA replication regulator [Campylobacterales bacterium]
YTDMLDIVFKSYIFWYIGRGDDKLASYAKERNDSLLWIFDEQLPNSFYLKSYDEALDSKLVSMASLFDKTIDAVMFSKVKLG